MGQTLIAGQNCPVPQEELRVVVSTGASADVSSFRLHADGKTRQDEDFVFYGQPANEDGTVTLTCNGLEAAFVVNLRRMKQAVEKIAFAITVDAHDITGLRQVVLEIFHAGASLAVCRVDTAGRTEAALILGELYKRNGAWKFRFVAQGFNGGLKPLAEFYGVDIADDAAKPQPPASAPPASKINLSKVTLTKEAPRVDLKKQDAAHGLLRVNLNWHQDQASSAKNQDTGFLGGLFGRGKKSGGIDLDLGAYVVLKGGKQVIIQALGKNFGALQKEPYVQLMGDDRTGAQTEGEWLHVNGKNFDQIQEIVVYAFIYEGVPNWGACDGIVTMYAPGQPNIETRLSEGNNRLPMCAIARIANHRGDIRIERINRYFRGHADMDKALGWGLDWVSGSK